MTAPRQALVVSLDNLGDLVFASALAAGLKARWPGVAVTLWCKEYAQAVAGLVPGVERVFASDPFWDVAPGRPKGSRLHFLKTVLDIRERRCDLALSASQSSWAAAAVFAAGIPMRVGLSRSGNKRWLTHALPPEDRGRPVLAELGRLLEPFGGAAVPLRCVLDPKPLERRRQALTALMGAAPFAALHPFAGSTRRCVALKEWGRLAETLSGEGLGIFWVGAASELDALRALAPARAGWHYADRTGDGSLAEAAAAISLARFFIGHDSGPLHVASALGIACLGIFTPGEPRRTFPQGTGSWRLLERPSPEGVSAEDMLRELQKLRSQP